MLKTICYLSYPTRSPSILDLEILFDHTRKTNNELNIGGILIFRDNLFFQILEGEEAAVSSLYNKIETDSRHKNINLILNQPIEKLAFNNFDTGYSIIDNSESLYALYEYVSVANENKFENSKLFLSVIERFISLNV